MESLPENKILKYNPDTLVAVRRLYNLDKPGQMDEAIDLLDAWVKKQGHFMRRDFPREYLERVIILLKGSVERAKSQIDKMSEYFKANEYCDGVIVIVDIRNLNIMDLVKQINLTELKQVATLILEGYDTRVKNFFFISSSKTVDVLVKLFKQMISEKLGKRVHVLKEVEELHEHIEKELLPSDYGGDGKSLASLNDELAEVLSSEENIQYLKEMSRARTNESLRTSSTYNEEFLGLAGSFRTMNFD